MLMIILTMSLILKAASRSAIKRLGQLGTRGHITAHTTVRTKRHFLISRHFLVTNFLFPKVASREGLSTGRSVPREGIKTRLRCLPPANTDISSRCSIYVRVHVSAGLLLALCDHKW